jgi:hypothetical protein
MTGLMAIIKGVAAGGRIPVTLRGLFYAGSAQPNEFPYIFCPFKNTP